MTPSALTAVEDSPGPAGVGDGESEVHPLHTADNCQETGTECLSMPSLCLLAQDTRERSKHICEEAASAQEKAKGILRMCQLARQRRLDARQVIPC